MVNHFTWVISFFLIFCGWVPEWAQGTAAKAAEMRVIDVHNHLFGRFRSRGGTQFDYEGAASVAIKEMNRLSIKKAFIMPPPFISDQPDRYTGDELVEVVRKYPDRFAFLDGGGSLNVMIQKAAREEKMGQGVRERFEKEAQVLLSRGAIGFGEMTAEHFSFSHEHPYESAPPDHPLFLLLSDIAARHDVPIDIHMEAVPQEMAFPAMRGRSSPNNPKSLRSNMAAFERLLAHNRNTRVIWDHVGWCNTGFRTPSLCAALLEKNPNLFMSFKIRKDSLPDVSPLVEERLKPEWVDLLKRHPDRFLIGTDCFYVSPLSNARPGPMTTKGTELLLKQLPQEVLSKVTHENALRVFGPAVSR